MWFVLLRLLSGSGVETGDLSPCCLAQPLHVPSARCAGTRRLSEQPLVLPAELRGVVAAHPQAGARGIQVLAESGGPTVRVAVRARSYGADRGAAAEGRLGWERARMGAAPGRAHRTSIG